MGSPSQPGRAQRRPTSLGCGSQSLRPLRSPRFEGVGSGRHRQPGHRALDLGPIVEEGTKEQRYGMKHRKTCWGIDADHTSR